MEQTFWFLKKETNTFHRMPFTFCGKGEAIAFALGCGISNEWNPIHARELVSPEYVAWIKSCVLSKEEKNQLKEENNDLLTSLSWPPSFE